MDCEVRDVMSDILGSVVAQERLDLSKINYKASYRGTMRTTSIDLEISPCKDDSRSPHLSDMRAWRPLMRNIYDILGNSTCLVSGRVYRSTIGPDRRVSVTDR